MRHLVSLARYLALPALSVVLVACGGGSSSDDDDDEALTSINGSYLSECFVTSAMASSRFLYVALDGKLTITRTNYGDGVCTTITMMEVATADYVLGDLVTVDDSFDGITSATQIDVTNTTAGDPDRGEVTYDIIAEAGDLAYVGEADGANDGTTPATRHNQLDEDFPLTKQ